MYSDETHEFFRHCPLFSHLDRRCLKALDSKSKEILLSQGEVLLHEGDLAKELFFLMEGTLEVLKNGQCITTLHPGDTVGELALIDAGQRSASVRAATAARLRHISFKDLAELSTQEDLSSVYREISRRTSQKLRQTTEVAAMALKNELEEYKTRVHMGRFLVYIIVVLTLFIYSVEPLQYALSQVPNTTYISIPLIIALTTFVFAMMRTSELPFSVFGITAENRKKSIADALFFSIPILGLIVLFKWLAIQFLPSYEGHPLFEPFALVKGDKTILYWLILNFIYWLFVPVQELMARGALQGLLEKFLTGKNRVWVSIFISNLIFSTAHVFISEQLGLIIFAIGLYFGWLYSRTHNLAGVIIAHCLIGTWGLSVVGPVINP